MADDEHPERDVRSEGTRPVEVTGEIQGQASEQEKELGPPSGEVRIDAVAAAVAAGLVQKSEAAHERAHEPGPPTEAYQLPDWTDPPTGQVPRLLLDDPSGAEEPAAALVHGPVWREGMDDWDQGGDLSFLIEHDEHEVDLIAGRQERVEDPFGFSELEANDEQPVAPSEEAQAKAALDAPFLTFEKQSARPHRAHQRRRRRNPPKNALVATVTGVIFGAVALGCFFAGALACLVLAAVVLTVAAGELYGSLFRAGFKPATVIGLLAVPALVVGAYLRGPEVYPVVLGLSIVASLLWYLGGFGKTVGLSSLGVTLLGVCWVGVLGSYAGLLLSPASYAHRHGVAFIVAGVSLTVAHDVGSYATGATIGRHKLAARVSPGKTIEGLLGGSALCIVVAGVVISRLHPFDLSHALELGVLVCVAAPLGDLVESFVKRELLIKDMGSLLPAHGGAFDRIDAMLFVLPATYYLVRLAHL